MALSRQRRQCCICLHLAKLFIVNHCAFVYEKIEFRNVFSCCCHIAWCYQKMCRVLHGGDKERSFEVLPFVKDETDDSGLDQIGQSRIRLSKAGVLKAVN